MKNIAGNRSQLIERIYRAHFPSYVDFAFRQLHPGQHMRKPWFVELLADRVWAIARRDNRRLVINAPPRSLKSFIATICLASFTLGRRPEQRILLLFGHDGLANETMTRLQLLMQSTRYCSLFPKLQLQVKGTTFTTQHGGQIRSAIVGRPLSGHGADLIVVDDPLSPSKALNATDSETVNTWYDQEVAQRLNNGKVGAIVLVMQRVSTGDLSGYLAGDPTFERVVLPAVAPRDEVWTLSDGRRFTRSRGQVLDPGHDTIEDQHAFFEQLGSYVYATQYLQNCCGSEDSRPMLLFAPRPDNWTPETDQSGCAMISRTYARRILTQVFGHPPHETDSWVPEYPYTIEEWEAATVIQQRALVKWAQQG